MVYGYKRGLILKQNRHLKISLVHVIIIIVCFSHFGFIYCFVVFPVIYICLSLNFVMFKYYASRLLITMFIHSCIYLISLHIDSFSTIYVFIQCSSLIVRTLSFMSIKHFTGHGHMSFQYQHNFKTAQSQYLEYNQPYNAGLQCKRNYLWSSVKFTLKLWAPWFMRYHRKPVKTWPDDCTMKAPTRSHLDDFIKTFP